MMCKKGALRVHGCDDAARKWSRVIAKTCCLGALVAAACFAQTDRAALVGTVRDASGSVVPDTAITVTYPATGLRRDAVSSDVGVYRISGLPLGECVVEVMKTGFRPIRTDAITLRIGETRTLDFSLDLASLESTVEVRAVSEALVQSTASFGDVTAATQLNTLPVNGRNWAGLMALVAGAIDPAGGDQKGVRFFAAGGNDNNFRVDGIDATSIRDQGQRAASRLLISEDAIAEFRVNSSLYSAESGGSTGGQVEVVSKSGTNQFHGTAFEFLRNNVFDARSPFDPSSLPPFRLNQFGAAIGGPVFKDKTFFFLSYEGIAQRRSQTAIGFVPTVAFRQRALATSPVIKPLLDAYPAPTGATSNPDIGQWTGVGTQSQDEHVGLLRLDHRFSDRLSSYFRFTRNDTKIDTPVTDSSGILNVYSHTTNSPITGVIQLLYVHSPRAINEFRFGVNYVPYDSNTDPRTQVILKVSGFTTLPNGSTRVQHSLSETIVDQFTLVRGRHTFKAGIEIRKPIINVWYSLEGNLIYASVADFAANKLTQADGVIENPARTMDKYEWFPYVQDEWKITPNLTASLGLRWELYNVFREASHRSVAFDLQYCGGYCTRNTWGYADTNNLAPRISLAWSPKRFHDKTVIRVGGGIYYGDAGLGDQLLPWNNDAQRFFFTAGTNPGLAYPIDFFNAAKTSAAPIAGMFYPHNEQSQQWGLQVQQVLPTGFRLQAGYMGSENVHLFTRTYQNVINPATGKRPLANFDQIDTRLDAGVSSYNGLLVTVDRTTRSGLFFRANYAWAHALNDGSAGGGDATYPQNVACRSCEKANSQYDARHIFNSNVHYQLPFARGRRIGGWELSGIGTFRSGLPLNVTVSRKAADVLDGNVNLQRPNLVPGVSFAPPSGQSIDSWINPNAFAVPAKGTWGNAGRNLISGPHLFQIDAALVKDTKISERIRVVFRAEVFNVFNHPELGSPNVNWSAGPSFGRITTLSNQTPTGVGTCRSIQLALRLIF